ncbi:hypothetical protein [Candidatus Mancarchaeum acidiphilum]|nr:hypothetical protein [Candidatus Mancarchaeum acidiphilum]
MESVKPKPKSNPVLIAGFGWIAAGIVMIYTGYLIYLDRITSSNFREDIAFGLLLMIIGVLILALRSKINKIVEEKTAEANLKKQQLKS